MWKMLLLMQSGGSQCFASHSFFFSPHMFYMTQPHAKIYQKFLSRTSIFGVSIRTVPLYKAQAKDGES